MNAAVVTYPGSNCDDDTRFALTRMGWNVTSRWHKDGSSFDGIDLVVLPGGFSYGDYLRCGAMAALSPVSAAIRQFADSGGLVLGLCNGFQILCEMGLLPGALARNTGLKFICEDVFLQCLNPNTPWTTGLEDRDRLKIPIAHGDGRFVLSEEEAKSLLDKGRVLFRYCDSEGKDANPNGSIYGIAGLCNEAGNVLGMMPHPERATDLRSKDGERIWKSVSQHLGRTP